MKIEIVRGGGLAGIATRTELDSDALAPEPAHALVERVQGAGLDASTSAQSGARATHPDELVYELTARHGGQATRARYSEADLPEDVRKLISWVDGRPERVEAIEPPA
jgi:hypothetical protein